ncbi:unnamed protein product [Vitrella brassicaformis CCMP3155]|uniref:U2A'/phosphoprotein 32 family A C-terminal domain-containing protein n=1 Tax=Vitrella brassicaformis (strain CCMP3155) TaxID=1169540 RepID=A0A0G4GGI8_VITBC|nr:unnamed protein product [Vitrella brassicaformis CCMP3155]|eukprot:CEM28748.1 unnamed protein product [Vitrella brassicaformis CCMP3155]
MSFDDEYRLCFFASSEEVQSAQTRALIPLHPFAKSRDRTQPIEVPEQLTSKSSLPSFKTDVVVSSRGTQAAHGKAEETVSVRVFDYRAWREEEVAESDATRSVQAGVESEGASAAALDVGGRVGRQNYPVLRVTEALAFIHSSPVDYCRIRDKWVPMLRGMGLTVPVMLVRLVDTHAAMSKGQPADDETIRHLLREIGAQGYLECCVSPSEAPAAGGGMTPATTMGDVLRKMAELARGHRHALEQEKRQRLAARELEDQRLEQLQRDFDRRPPSAVDGTSGLLRIDRLKNLDEMVVMEADETPLTVADIPSRLSLLGPTPDGSHAYLRADLGDMGLTTIDPLEAFINLQYVDVSHNRLRSLCSLYPLVRLRHVNASHNMLRRSIGFHFSQRLEVVDLSYNYITAIGDFSSHRFLRELNLRGNMISAISEGLAANKGLTALDLSENQLRYVDNLDDLNIEELHVSGNQLVSLAGGAEGGAAEGKGGVCRLTKLRELNVRDNMLDSVEGLGSQHAQLITLHLCNNRFTHPAQLELLAKLPLLTDLFLTPMAIENVPAYRMQVIHRLPHLRWLDCSAVSSEEKVKTAIVYGDKEDIEARQHIFHTLIPGEPFTDWRLLTEEMMEELERQTATGPPASALHHKHTEAAERNQSSSDELWGEIESSIVMPPAPGASVAMPPAPAAGVAMPAVAGSVFLPKAPNVSMAMPTAADSMFFPSAPNVSAAMPAAPAGSVVVPQAPAGSVYLPQAPNVSLLIDQ